MCWLTMFFPQVVLCCFCDTDNVGGSLKVCVFFPPVPRLADSPARLLHQRAVGRGLRRRGGGAQVDVWGPYI